MAVDGGKMCNKFNRLKRNEQNDGIFESAAFGGTLLYRHPKKTKKKTWHAEAARDAQRWADQCQFLIHDNVTGRWVDDFGSCGQNIFVSTHQVPW